MSEGTQGPAGSPAVAGIGYGYWFRWYYARYLYWFVVLAVAPIALEILSDFLEPDWSRSPLFGLVLILAIAWATLAAFIGYWCLWPPTDTPWRAASGVRREDGVMAQQLGYQLERRW